MLLSAAIEVIALRGATHVNYEVQMLRGLPSRCARFEKERDSTAVNACLEACLVHARALIEFLGGRNADPRDIRAQQYAPRFVADKRLHHWLSAIDGHLAHLSWARAVDVETPRWDLQSLVDDVVASYGQFVAVVEPTHPCRALLGVVDG